MWCTLDVKEIQRQLKTSIKMGLTDEEAKIRKEKYGPNQLAEGKKENIFLKFIKQFNDFMIITLIIAAIISAVVSYLQATNDYIDSIIIIAIVVLNAIVGLIQESKAERSIEALKKLTAPMAKVKRNGIIKSINSEELVPGDIIAIETGDYVPADARLISANNLKVEESALTGETVPVLKDANVILQDNVSIGDMQNLIFETTMVVNGHAEAIVVETGMNTKVGKIAQMIIKDEAPETPLQRRLRRNREKTWTNLLIHLRLYIRNRFIKKNTSNGNIYDSSRASSSSNSRRLASCCNNYAINRCYKNGKEKQYY